MSYDPTQAGDPVPLKRINTMRCITNEIISMNDAVTRGRYFKGLPERVTGDEPYWDFYFQALDAKWERDDKMLDWNAAGKLYTIEGKQQDNNQRPSRVSVAYAGLRPPISVFPGDPEGKFDAWCVENAEDHEPIGANPSYDASLIVDRVFECEIVELKFKNFSLNIPLPRVAHPEGYLFAEDVRVLSSSGGDGVNPDGAAAPTNAGVDITKDGGEEERAKMLSLIDGQPITADFFSLIKGGGMDNTTSFNGESLTGAALDAEAFIEKLAALSLITVTDGRIAVA